MGIFRSWENWGEKAGEGSRDFLQDTGDAIVKNVCKLYGKYPKSLIISPYAKGFMGKFCEQVDEPFPDPPSPNFTGGQCEENYYLRASCEVELWFWTNFNFNSQGIVYPSVDSRDVGVSIVGAVSSVRFVSHNPCPEKDPDQDNCTYGGRIVYAVVNDAEGEKWLRTVLWTEAPFTGGSLTISKRNFLRRDTIANEQFDFQLTSGEPDLCGNVEPGFPPDPEFDPNDFNKTVVINNYNNNGDVINENEFNINIPTDIGENFDVCLNIGGAKICVGLDGYGGEQPEPEPKPEPEPEPKPEPEHEEQEEQEEEEKEVEGIKYVLLTITKYPSKGKTIIHANDANNTYFAGYFSWLIKVNGVNYRTEEVPIRKEKMIFKAPDDATGYAYYTVNNAAITATEYIKKPSETTE